MLYVLIVGVGRSKRGESRKAYIIETAVNGFVLHIKEVREPGKIFVLPGVLV